MRDKGGKRSKRGREKRSVAAVEGVAPGGQINGTASSNVETLQRDDNNIAYC